MNSKRFVLVLWLCLCAGMGWGQRVIEVPDFESTNTYTIDILKVELTDSVTVFSMQADQGPGGWIRIPSRTVLRGSDGVRVYRLLRADGLELDKQAFVPETGIIVFRLYFEPLRESETRVDFVEGDHEDDWVITGIYVGEGKARKIDSGDKFVLTGNVVDRPDSHRLILMVDRDDDRIQAPVAIIPIRDGCFEYECVPGDCKRYKLVFMDELARSSYYSNYFFIEPGRVNVTLYSRDLVSRNEVTGGKVTEEYRAFLRLQDEKFNMQKLYDRSDSLSRMERYYTPRVMELQGLMEAARNNRQKSDSLLAVSLRLEKSDSVYSSMLKEVMWQQRELLTKIQAWKEDYIAAHPSLMTLFLLYDEVRTLMEGQIFSYPDHLACLYTKDFARLKDLYNTVYKPMFPGHLYTLNIASGIESLTKIRVGGYYIDFTAPDLEGKMVRLSGQIKGKVTLIDLWTSWCGSCRETSKSMIPVYEKYKSKGFTVVGVARERQVESARNAIAMDGYPWLNLVDIMDAGKIWEKYCVENGGGGTFLVNRAGKILAINPMAGEVTVILEKLLK